MDGWSLLYAGIAVFVLVLIVAVIWEAKARPGYHPGRSRRSRLSERRIDRGRALDELRQAYERGELDQDTYERLVEDVRRRTAA